MTDINRGSANIILPEAVSNEILATAQELSVVQRAARQVPLAGSGVAVNVIAGDASPSWAGETSEVAVSNGAAKTLVLRPYKVSVIETFSNEFRRDLPALYNALAARLPGVLAKKFDTTVLGGEAAPGSDFDTLAAADAKAFTSYAELLAAFKAVTDNGGDVDGIVISPAGELDVLGLVDGNDRPLFIGNASTEGNIGSLLGRPVFKSKAAAIDANTIGVAGDWSKSIWGQVSNVEISISDQATLTAGDETINLWQKGMFAVKAEVEYAFRTADTADFVRLVKTVA